MSDPVELQPIKNESQKKRGKLQRIVSLNQMLLKSIQRKKTINQHRSPNNRVAAITCFYLSLQQSFMGGPSVINYPSDLIQGIFPKLDRVFPIIINISGIFGALLSICVLAKFGRRTIIVNGTLLQGICLFVAFVLCFWVDYENPYTTSFKIRFTLGITYILIRIILSATFSPVVDLYTN